mgnify:CR=1 FL=1
MTGSTSTSWEALANKHLGHKAKLLDHKHLRCFECAVTLVLPRDAAKVGVTGPPQYVHRPAEQPASPEMVALRKREALAAIELARQKRTTVVEDPS